MRALDRATDLFVASVREALPGARLQVRRSQNQFVRSNYVFIAPGGMTLPAKVRISDHAVVPRAMSWSDGEE